MAQKYNIITIGTYETHIFPESLATAWGLPLFTYDEETGEPIDPIVYTFKEAVEAANLGSSEPFLIQRNDPLPPTREGDGWVPDSYVVPLNQMGGDFDSYIVTVAEADSNPYVQTSLSLVQYQEYQKNGTLPPPIVVANRVLSLRVRWIRP